MAITHARIEVYNKNGRWQWKLLDNSGTTVARSNRAGYKTKDRIFKHMEVIKDLIVDVPITIRK
jgi:uncharacterized protein YegP (UPF0339 family)